MTKEEFALKWFDRKLDTGTKPGDVASVFWMTAAQRALDYEDMIKTETAEAYKRGYKEGYGSEMDYK